MRYGGILLAFIAGSVDTFSFLSLSGLFAAHVTGNFVLLGATLVLGHPAGVWSKVLAVPLFAAGVWAASIGSAALQRRHRALLPWLLGAEFVLLLAACGVAMARGPFDNADSPSALLLGLLLILAMGTQAALGQLAAPKEPATTVMTTTLTRLVVDLSVLVSRALRSEAEAERTRRSTVRLGEQCAAFLVGCAISAGGHVLIGLWSLALPTIAIALLLVASMRHDLSTGGQ
jgi:uncharacterized membrane protein YoaK (UPF0700 family)